MKNSCSILLIGTVLAMGEYGWGALVILLVLGVCGGYFVLRWCRRTVKDVAKALHGEVESMQGAESSPELDEGAKWKKEIKKAITQVKSDLVQINQEREDAIKETLDHVRNRRDDSVAMKDYRLFYEMKVKDIKVKLSLTRAQLKIIPNQKGNYHAAVTRVLQQIEELLQSYHPDHQHQ